MPKFKLIYLPPLLIYASAGISGITGIVGIFFIKDFLNLSAAFIASIGFWAGIPWSLKMPVGFLIDKYWNFKHYFVYLGAFIISVSLIIMYGVLVHTNDMQILLSVEAWFILSSILTPVGYVLQDVVADAMTVEAVEPNLKNNTRNLINEEIKAEHTLVQLYGRFAIIFGSLLVGLINFLIFNFLEDKYTDVSILYGNIYLFALIVPFVSIIGVLIWNYSNKNKSFIKNNISNSLDYKIFIGSCFFVIFAIILGSLKLTYSREIVLISSLVLISILMRMLLKGMDVKHRSTIIGTAIIIFVFRAMPGPGPGLNWFEIDVLGFDQSFFSLLTIISASVTLLGILIFRKLMIRTSLSKLFIILSILSSLLYFPSLFLYYDLHEFTSSITYGIVDARFIAVLNTAVESPLSQVAMIPLLAWIARNAPLKYKATFFAVFASFTNLALSARELFTSYLNKIFVIKRKVETTELNKITEQANYDDLDNLIISLILITAVVPILTILVIQRSKYKSKE
ncbi:MAG: hypothetical protein CMP36_02305 [Rickettsiales bacterium]|nr:hypothetical protein [Rickettsiales bacterium]OUV80911.1 MAG: hypothetical protein CBC91_02835 [Rickettsiales bacterium TMED131]